MAPPTIGKVPTTSVYIPPTPSTTAPNQKVTALPTSPSKGDEIARLLTSNLVTFTPETRGGYGGNSQRVDPTFVGTGTNGVKDLPDGATNIAAEEVGKQIQQEEEKKQEKVSSNSTERVKPADPLIVPSFGSFNGNNNTIPQARTLVTV